MRPPFMCVQYSQDWWEIRIGRPTASGFDRIITAVTGKKSSAQKKYMYELAADIVSFGPNFITERANRAKSHAMEEGTNREPESRRHYEMVTESPVQQVGFCMSDCGRYGCSPDGLVGENGVLELKNPELKTHLEWLADGVLPNDYKVQCHGHLVVTGREWCDFYSYVDPPIDPFRVRVEPTPFTATLKNAVEEFCGEYFMMLAKLGLQPRKAG